MTKLTIEKINDNELKFSGILTRETVASIFSQAEQYLPANQSITINCAGVTQTDSAGVALLVDWCRRAKKKKSHIELIKTPAQMEAIIDVSHLAQILDH